MYLHTGKGLFKLLLSWNCCVLTVSLAPGQSSDSANELTREGENYFYRKSERRLLFHQHLAGPDKSAEVAGRRPRQPQPPWPGLLWNDQLWYVILLPLILVFNSANARCTFFSQPEIRANSNSVRCFEILSGKPPNTQHVPSPVSTSGAVLYLSFTKNFTFTLIWGAGIKPLTH